MGRVINTWSLWLEMAMNLNEQTWLYYWFFVKKPPKFTHTPNKPYKPTPIQNTQISNLYKCFSKSSSKILLCLRKWHIIFHSLDYFSALPWVSNQQRHDLSQYLLIFINDRYPYEDYFSYTSTITISIWWFF